MADDLKKSGENYQIDISFASVIGADDDIDIGVSSSTATDLVDDSDASGTLIVGNTKVEKSMVIELAGGIPGHEYQIRAKCTTTNGRDFHRDVYIKVIA